MLKINSWIIFLKFHPSLYSACQQILNIHFDKTSRLMGFEYNLNNKVKTTCYYQCIRAIGFKCNARLLVRYDGKTTIKGEQNKKKSDFKIYSNIKEIALDLSNNPLGIHAEMLKRLNEQKTESVYAI
ncbi:hypothetical protein HZS_6555 [Henneguya salminicola]|nr:hypothetical protein HZS_6555 [Henneguya salminicola]